LAGLAYKHRVSDLFTQPIDATTRYCAVYGHPVKHSASPAMQNAGIAALGLNWRYLAFEVHPDQLRAALAGAQAMRFVGVNLTVPHKLLAMDMVDVLDESARTWGAVNTVRFEGRKPDGKWVPLHELSGEPQQIRSHGFNTDADAISRAVREDLELELEGATVLLLGAGGAGRTAALKLATERVAQLHLVNRTESKACQIAAEINERFPGIKVAVGYPQGSIDLLLNATSLGLKADDPLPFDQQRFKLSQAKAVYDMIYRPAETELLRRARAAGGRAVNGLGMLLYQGAKALELWSGLEAPVQKMHQALERNVYGEQK
jgi:shikimate dehydrogenase